MHYKYDFFLKILKLHEHGHITVIFLQLFLHVIHMYSVYADTVNVLRSIFPVFVFLLESSSQKG